MHIDANASTNYSAFPGKSINSILLSLKQTNHTYNPKCSWIRLRSDSFCYSELVYIIHTLMYYCAGRETWFNSIMALESVYRLTLWQSQCHCWRLWPPHQAHCKGCPSDSPWWPWGTKRNLSWVISFKIIEIIENIEIVVYLFIYSNHIITAWS